MQIKKILSADNNSIDNHTHFLTSF